MYRCSACQKSQRLGSGKCESCGKELTWEPRPSIDDKEKSGDLDQFGLVWAAYQCICENASDVTGTEFTQKRKAFARKVNALPSEDESDVSTKVGKLKKRIDGLALELGAPYRQFVINLALFDYRTSGGGRARKNANWLRTRKSGGIDEDVYNRPFEDPLPHVVEQLLSNVPPGTLQFDATSTVAFTSGGNDVLGYVPPSRFTASFPLHLTGVGEHDRPRPLRNPQFPSGTDATNAALKFGYMGSFGFSEPSYSAWNEEGADGPEYSGTRLNLGAYSLNEAYLGNLLHLLEQTERSSNPDHLKGYLAYGGVKKGHVQKLLGIASRAGHTLAATWMRQLVLITRALVAAAREKVDQHQGLTSFFGLLQEKIDRMEFKVAQLEKTANDLTAFEYLWVQESNLWELAVLAASCLSLSEVQATLGTLVEKMQAPWKPTLGAEENAIREELQGVPTGREPCSLHRLLAPTGMAAGRSLFDVLTQKLKYAPHLVTPDKDKLHTFTPYFEFYIGGILNDDPVGPSAKGTQIWVNLSESLHTDLIDAGKRAEKPGKVIASLLGPYLGTLGTNTSKPTVLVIDFTKFAGEMPNQRLYPILGQLARALTRNTTSLDIVFLRSNLKYNTGSLDRYQVGEVLVFNQGPSQLIEEVEADFKRIFTKGVDVYFLGAKKWGLQGEYLSLMRKVYTLSDAIGTWRWAEYEKHW
ncbi:hypothetical protein LY474_20290 [Myxococcus stipitatus]|uniref:hypothetical protein n=1 Tax=Myxococcus stipitatus TaxID=83455 RepID=UPI001F220C70|nr:hypothetical protein [Myxococcus stipitatus]MCE9670142.1 hypothetical protein [Myxococcus stipitatus]